MMGNFGLAMGLLIVEGGGGDPIVLKAHLMLVTCAANHDSCGVCEEPASCRSCAAWANLGNTKRLKLQRSDRGRHLLRQAGQWIDLVKIQDGKQ
jgi:hypothetical protein